jgi:arsenate reductase
MKKKVLFICTHNSARSQMAEAFLNHKYATNYEAFSAGLQPTEVNKDVIHVMKEIGIDISKNKSKPLKPFLSEHFDYVVTVCDNAKETCPYFPNAQKHLHTSFPDPSALSASRNENIRAIRVIRDNIEQWIEETFGHKEQ